jgi:hypothetical protein
MWRVWRGKYLFFIRPQAKYEDFLLRWTCIRPNSSFLCEQVILNSVSISPHMERCAAIAEVESGERVEKSLFEPPEGMTRVPSVMAVFFRDPSLDVAKKQDQEGVEAQDGTKDPHEEGKQEGTVESATEGTGSERLPVAGTGEASSPGLFTDSAASAALLSLNASNSKLCSGKVAGNALECAGERE